jgi:putative flippase GtrA
MRDVFSSDSHRALRATPVRRVICYGPVTLILVVSLFFANALSPWFWPAFLIVDFIIFAFIGNYWANKDALAREAVASET